MTVNENHLNPYFKLRLQEFVYCKTLIHRATYQLLLNPAETPTLSFEPWLFNQDVYWKQWETETLTFYWFNDISQQADALVVLQKKEEGVWLSPFRATFAGFDGREGVDFESFVKAVKLALAACNILSITIKACPRYVQPDFYPIFKQVFTHVKVDYTELNYHLPISGASIHQHLHSSKRWRLNKLVKSGFVFEEMTNPNLADIHQFIAKARARKDFPMTLSLEEFIQNIQQLSNRYTFFAVKKGGDITAVAVCVRLGKGVFYNFYSADHELYTANSPMVLLFAGMYEYAYTNHYTVLDLGISTYLGVRNEGLIAFKKSIGAIETEKIVFSVEC